MNFGRSLCPSLCLLHDICPLAPLASCRLDAVVRSRWLPTLEKGALGDSERDGDQRFEDAIESSPCSTHTRQFSSETQRRARADAAVARSAHKVVVEREEEVSEHVGRTNLQ